jgi:hypothetical protein
VTSSYSSKTRLLMCLCSAGIMALVGTNAHGQRTPGSEIAIIIRYGTPHKFFTFEWDGITGTTVKGEPGILYERSYVWYVCQRDCPADIPKTREALEEKTDKVMWSNGSATSGKVKEVACQNDNCVVRQDGQADRSWNDLRYILFAPQGR